MGAAQRVLRVGLRVHVLGVLGIGGMGRAGREGWQQLRRDRGWLGWVHRGEGPAPSWCRCTPGTCPHPVPRPFLPHGSTRCPLKTHQPFTWHNGTMAHPPHRATSSSVIAVMAPQLGGCRQVPHRLQCGGLNRHPGHPGTRQGAHGGRCGLWGKSGPRGAGRGG